MPRHNPPRFIKPFAPGRQAASLQNERNTYLFCIEGVLITLVLNLVNNNNNLFATRLGASPFQLSLVTGLPQFIGLLVLIPGGIVTDRMRNKRRMVIFTLAGVMILYVALGLSPYFGDFRLWAFLFILTASAGPMTLYNTSWQAFFADVVPGDSQNRTLSARSRLIFFIGVVTPVFTGALLSSVAGNEGKIWYHQIFSWSAAVLILLQILTVGRITGGDAAPASGLRLRDYVRVGSALFRNKLFTGFVGAVFLYHAAWYMDITLYYYGEVTFLKANELWLGYISVGSALFQFLTIGFLSRLNEKYGVRFMMIIGSFGLAVGPLSMISSTYLPPQTAIPVFLVFHGICDSTLSIMPMNLLQCLLQVVDPKNKTLSIAVYTVFITLANATMPVLIMRIFTSLGENLAAYRTTYLIIMAFRAAAVGVWALRWYMLRKMPDSHSVTAGENGVQLTTFVE